MFNKCLINDNKCFGRDNNGQQLMTLLASRLWNQFCHRGEVAHQIGKNQFSQWS